MLITWLTHNLKKTKKKNKLPSWRLWKKSITDQYWYRQGSCTFTCALCFVMVGVKVLVQPSERTTMVNKRGWIQFYWWRETILLLFPSSTTIHCTCTLLVIMVGVKVLVQPSERTTMVLTKRMDPALLMTRNHFAVVC